MKSSICITALLSALSFAGCGQGQLIKDSVIDCSSKIVAEDIPGELSMLTELVSSHPVDWSSQLDVLIKAGVSDLVCVVEHVAAGKLNMGRPMASRKLLVLSGPEMQQKMADYLRTRHLTVK